MSIQHKTDASVIGSYWANNFVHPKFNVCGLCGNRGIVRTSPTTPAGYHLEFETFCFCPNGQLMREDAESQKLDVSEYIKKWMGEQFRGITRAGEILRKK